MTEIGLFEAKNKFSELVERASGGEEIVVLKHGKPKARIVSVETADASTRALDEIERFRRSLSQYGAIDEIIADKNFGRR